MRQSPDSASTIIRDLIARAGITEIEAAQVWRRYRTIKIGEVKRIIRWVRQAETRGANHG